MDDYGPFLDDFFSDMGPDQSFADFLGDLTWNPEWDQYFEDVDFNDPDAPSMGEFFGDQTTIWDTLGNIKIPGLPGALGGGTLGGLFASPLGGLLLGAGLGVFDGSKQAGTTTTTQEPWGPQQQYLTDIFGRGRTASQVAAFPSPDEMISYNQGLGLSSGGAGQIANTFSGAYMNPDNPLYKSILDDATQQVSSRFYNQDQTGPLGSRPGFAETFGKTMGNQLSANLFNPERQRQVAYATMFNPASGQAAAQGMRMDPFRSLQPYSDLVRGSHGGTTTEPYFTNPFAGGLGGALMGSEIWRNLFPKD